MNDDKPMAKGERRDKEPEKEPGPLTEQVGTHPLGTAAGALAGAAAGALSGLAAGPVGSLVGAVGGAALGGAAGASTGGARPLDTSAIDAYWRDNFAGRPYVPAGARYDDYEPAYRYGTQSYLATDHAQAWEEVEDELSAGWPSARGESRLDWNDTRHAVRDAWQRLYDGVERLAPGDSDGDGR